MKRVKVKIPVFLLPILFGIFLGVTGSIKANLAYAESEDEGEFYALLSDAEATFVQWDSETYQEDGMTYAYGVMIGFNDDEQECWSRKTKNYPVLGMFSEFGSLGTSDDLYYYYEEIDDEDARGRITAVKISDGSVYWEKEFPNVVWSNAVFDKEGTAYFAGYNNHEDISELAAIDKDGNVINHTVLTDFAFFMPDAMEYKEGKLYISMCEFMGDTPLDLVVSTDAFSYNVKVDFELGNTEEENAYLEFLSTEIQASIGVDTMYTAYDFNGDGRLELLLHIGGEGDGQYLMYGYDGTQVNSLGTCDNFNRYGTYYSEVYNALVIVSSGGSDWITYEYYKVGKQLELFLTIEHRFFGPGLGMATEDNPDGYANYTFMRTDERGLRSDITASDWEHYVNELEEITLTKMETYENTYDVYGQE